jgi:hypothetical protein
VSLHVDRATHALGGADGPVLLERTGTVDGWLIGAGRDIDVVCATVGVDGSLVLASTAGIVCAIGFDDVVLDERVASPAIDSKISVTAWVERTAIVDGAAKLARSKGSRAYIPASAWVPALTTDEVASVSPGHRVSAALAHGVLSRPAAISPPGVEVAVMVASRARSALTLLEQGRVVVTFVEKVERSRDDSSDCRQGKKKRLE